jgi:hypothetical protein
MKLAFEENAIIPKEKRQEVIDILETGVISLFKQIFFLINGTRNNRESNNRESNNGTRNNLL